MSFEKTGDVVPLNIIDATNTANKESEFIKFGFCISCNNECMINVDGMCKTCANK